MRIAFLSTFYPYRGGIAQFNAALYRELEKNHTVKAFTFTRQYPDLLFPGKSQMVTSTDESDKIEAARVLDTINPFTYYSAAKKIKAFKPDILIFKYWMTFFAPSLGSVAYLLKKDCKIISILDNVIPHEKRFGDKALTQFFINQNDGFVAMSDSVLNDLNQFTDNQNKVFIPHPIYNIFGNKIPKAEALAHLNLDANDRHLLFFGFIRRYKGLDLLLETMANDKIRQLNIKLIIAGECYEDWNFYQDLINKYDLAKNIILKTDYIPSEEIKYYFSAADMVVQPYRTATQSGVTQIAYNFERPMLVTDVGGLAEIVPNRKVGYVTDTNAISIVEALMDFYTNNREDMFSQNAAMEKKRFEWDSFTKAIEDLAANIVK
ncbi:MAG: glycosyltransferase [Bacteroidota bacterium]